MDPPVALPLDILEYITDILAADREEEPYQPTLQALSLTCKFMVPLCRRHLFSSFTLSSFALSRISSLKAMLHMSPDIARHMKSLTYEVQTPVIRDDQHRIVLEILHGYSSSLQSISLGSRTNVDWNALPEPIKSILLSLLQVPTITRVKLQSFRNFPVAALSLCGRLSDLRLEAIDNPSLPDGSHVIAPSKLPSAVSLHAKGGSYGALAALMQSGGSNASGPIIDFSHLRDACFDIHASDNAESLGELLKTTTELEYLEMNVNSPWLSRLIGANLAANSHRTLRSANISIIVEGAGYEPLCGFNVALRLIAGENALAELEIDVTVQTDELCRTDSEDWSDVDAVLTESGAFPSLRRVRINLCWFCFNRHPDDLPNILGKLTVDRFPRLVESSAIEFTFLEEHDYI